MSVEETERERERESEKVQMSESRHFHQERIFWRDGNNIHHVILL